MIYEITPVPKPRQTQSDRWNKRPRVMRYRAFAEECRLKGVTVENGDSIKFFMPMPKSWSNVNKSIMTGAAHKQKPDLDNLLKALMDAVLKEDCIIHKITSIEKVWAVKGAIEIIRDEKVN
jgi:Holliday junction resolvase RusA-like endonuclease